MKRLVAFICFTFIGFWIYSQEITTLYFHVDKISIKKKASLDSTFYEFEKRNALEQFALLGYTSLFIEDSTLKSSSIHYYFTYEKHFDRVILKCINDSLSKKKDIRNNNYTSTVRDINKEINILENNGYPFASIKIVTQIEKENNLILEYRIDSGAFFIIDEIVIKSESQINDKTLLNIINISPGDTYNEQKIKDIKGILEDTRLFILRRSPQIVFTSGKAKLYLFVEKEKSSSADGYIGLQQDQITQKLALNGYINLKLNNSLNRAEVIELNWKNNPNKTQNLHAIFQYPYIFNSPIGIAGDINLQKQDSTFIKSDLIFDLTYIHPKFKFSLFDQIEGSNIISSTIPPGFRDYKKNTVGLKIEYRPTIPFINDFFHPKIGLLGGFYNYRSDTIDNNKQKTSNSKYALEYSHSIDLLSYFHLNNSLSFQGLSSSIEISRNELIYFGGLKSVRGFYELELFGNNIWILKNELEFTPIKTLSLKLLYDYSVFEYNGHHFTNSFGFGFGLISKSNTLDIIIANGNLDGNPLELANTKIHIGFKSSF